MAHGRWKLLVALVCVLSLVAVACSGGDGDGGGDEGGDDTGDTQPNPQPDPSAEIACGVVLDESALVTEGLPVIDPDLIVVPVAELAAFEATDVAQVAQRLVLEPGPGEVGLDQVLERSGFGSMEQAYPDLFNLDSASRQSWDAVESEIATFQLEAGSAEQALGALRDAGVGAEPVHMVWPSNHFGAYPGVAPQICDATGWAVPEPSGQGRRIGVVDTGFVDGSPSGVVTPGPAHLDAGHSDPACPASHGEFVASMIRQVAPDTVISGRRGFGHRSGNGWNCWSSNELLIRLAVLDLPLDKLDALNLSLGSLPHHDHDRPEEAFGHITFEETIAQAVAIKADLEIYAAAGNAYSSQPIFPAALPEPAVIAVGALSIDGDWIQWDQDHAGGSVPKAAPAETTKDALNHGPGAGTGEDNDFSWIDVLAAGCDLIGTGLHGNADTQVIVWSGSSFASPIAAALGARPAKAEDVAIVDHAQLSAAMVGDGVANPRQCA